MKKVLSLLWQNRTRSFGFLQGLVALLATMTDVFGPGWLKGFLIANAVLTYTLGQFNSWQSKNSPPKPDVTGG